MAFWDNWYGAAKAGVSSSIQGAENLVSSLFKHPSTTAASVDPADVQTDMLSGQSLSTPEGTGVKVTTVYGPDAPTFFQGVEVQNANGSVVKASTGPATSNFGGLLTAINKVSAPGFLKSTLAKTLALLLLIVFGAVFVYGLSRRV